MALRPVSINHKFTGEDCLAFFLVVDQMVFCMPTAVCASLPVLLLPSAANLAVLQIRGDESMYEDDMSAPHEGAVWLVGEQRWSKPSA